MAARRLLSLIAMRNPHKPLLTVTRDFHHNPKSFTHSYEAYTRKFQTLAEVNNSAVEKSEEPESSKPVSVPVVSASNSNDDATSVQHRVNSSLKISERHDLVMLFSCKVCETRSMKSLCRESYEKGVVLARCDGCNNLHLIADRLGWFGEPGSVEELLATRGEEVKKGSVDTLSLTLEDLAGTNNLKT